MPTEAKKAAMLGRRMERALPLGRRTGGHFMPPVLEPVPGLESEQGWASTAATRKSEGRRVRRVRLELPLPTAVSTAFVKLWSETVLQELG